MGAAKWFGGSVNNAVLACYGCGRRMQKHPKTDDVVQRRAAPHAALCVDCKLKRPCPSRCEQCKDLRRVGLVWVSL